MQTKRSHEHNVKLIKQKFDYQVVATQESRCVDKSHLDPQLFMTSRQAVDRRHHLEITSLIVQHNYHFFYIYNFISTSKIKIIKYFEAFLSTKDLSCAYQVCDLLDEGF